VYREEFPRIKNHTVLENKYFGHIEGMKPIDLHAKKELRFLISGTLTEVYGILEGIEWFKSIQTSYPEATLTLIGHVPIESFQQKLTKSTADQSSIHLHFSDIPLPYSAILKAYQETNIVLLPYHQIPSISPKIPSKMYESIALGKPCLFQNNPKWEALCSVYPAGKGIDFRDLIHSKQQLDSFLKTPFFVNKPGEEVLWKSDETNFLDKIRQLTEKV